MYFSLDNLVRILFPFYNKKLVYHLHFDYIGFEHILYQGYSQLSSKDQPLQQVLDVSISIFVILNVSSSGHYKVTI